MLLIVGLVLIGIAVGMGVVFFRMLYSEPTTDGLQNVFRLIFAVIGGGILLAVGSAGLCCASVACRVRPWGAKRG